MDDAALWGFLGTLVGAAATFAASYFTAKQAARSQADAVGKERAVRQQLMQRETLIELQNELSNLLRSNALIFMDDVDQHRQGTPWSRTVQNAEVSEATRRAFAQVSMLNSRVTDDEVRAEVWKIRTLLNSVLDARDYQEALPRHQEAMTVGIDAIEKIGEQIRRCGTTD